MHLTIAMPDRIALDVEASSLRADAVHGSFTLLERHIDTVAILVPGLLTVRSGDSEQFVAVDGGVLVKAGGRVRVSTPRAVRGDLGELERIVEETFRQMSEREEQVRTALDKIQADFVRRFMELQHRA